MHIRAFTIAILAAVLMAGTVSAATHTMRIYRTGLTHIVYHDLTERGQVTGATVTCESGWQVSPLRLAVVLHRQSQSAYSRLGTYPGISGDPGESVSLPWQAFGGAPGDRLWIRIQDGTSLAGSGCVIRYIVN